MASGSIPLTDLKIGVRTNINCNSATSEKNALDMVWNELARGGRYTFGAYAYAGMHQYIGFRMYDEGTDKYYGWIMSFKYDGHAWIYFVNANATTLKSINLSNA